MKLVIQRVLEANVSIEKKLVAQINQGLLVFVSFGVGDSSSNLDKAVRKLIHLRVFSDQNSKFNYSVQDINGEILLVSQFTLHAKLKGNRPSFLAAVDPKTAKQLYQVLITKLKHTSVPIKTGKFGANMQVHLINDGPVTIIANI